MLVSVTLYTMIYHAVFICNSTRPHSFQSVFKWLWLSFTFKRISSSFFNEFQVEHIKKSSLSEAKS